MLARLHAIEDGQLVSGAAAFAALWRALPRLRPLGLLARRRWVLWLLDRLYEAFLDARPHMQEALLRIELGRPTRELVKHDAGEAP